MPSRSPDLAGLLLACVALLAGRAVSGEPVPDVVPEPVRGPTAASTDSVGGGPSSPAGTAPSPVPPAARGSRLGVATWEDGWSLLAGAGVSSSRYITRNESREEDGEGPGLMTSVGYCDRGSYCLETGSLVSFNHYEDLLATPPGGEPLRLDAWFWETALFVAIRARVPGTRPRGHFDPWVKLFSGYGASVGFPDGIPSGAPDSIADRRIHMEGPLYGVSLMNIFHDRAPGRVWFVEATAFAQISRNNWLIKEGGIVPEVTSSGHTEGNPYTLFLNLTVGLRLF